MIDFKVPKYWVKGKFGNSHYPDEIKDWFSEDFDNYFIYHHPIYIDLDMQNGLKSTLDNLGRPKNKRILKFEQFKSEFFKSGESFKDYHQYVMHQVRIKDTRPNYLWGSPEGSSIYINDILELLAVFDSSFETEVYCHYDILRKTRANLEHENLPSFFLTKMKDLETVAKKFVDLSPEFILEKNKKWCLQTLYDDCKTAIACDNEIAEKLIEHEQLGIEKIIVVHNNI